MVHQLGDDRQAGLLARLGEQPQPLAAEALEAVRRGAGLVGAAAQHRGAAVGSRLRAIASSCVAALDRAGAGDQGEVVAADLSPVDVDDVGSPLLNCARGKLVRLQDRHEVVDAGGALRSRSATRSRSPIAPITVRSSPGDTCAEQPTDLDAVDDGLDLLLASRPSFITIIIVRLFRLPLVSTGLR